MTASKLLKVAFYKKKLLYVDMFPVAEKRVLPLL